MTNKSAANHQVVWPPRNPWYPYELPPRLQETPEELADVEQRYWLPLAKMVRP